MFDNIGGKIKGLAKLIFWIISIACIILGCITIIYGFKNPGDNSQNIMPSILRGSGIAIGGVIMAWLQNFLLYGFGELVDSNQKILKELERWSLNSNQQKPTVYSSLEKPQHQEVKEVKLSSITPQQPENK